MGSLSQISVQSGHQGEEEKVFKFEKLEVWKKSIDLYKRVSEVSSSIAQKEQFSLGEQLYPYPPILPKGQEGEETKKPNTSLILLKVRFMRWLAYFT